MLCYVIFLIFLWALLLNVLYCVFQWVKMKQYLTVVKYFTFWDILGRGGEQHFCFNLNEETIMCLCLTTKDKLYISSILVHSSDFFFKKSHNFIQIIMAHNCKLFSTKIPMPWDKVTSKTNLPLIWKKQIKESYNLQNGSSNLSPQMTIISPFYCFIFLILSG